MRRSLTLSGEGRDEKELYEIRTRSKAPTIIVVAMTRRETMLADVAVAVHRKTSC